MATYYVKVGVDDANENWEASTAYSVDDIVAPTTHTTDAAKYMYKCTTAGTSGSTEPTWDNTVGNTTSDGSVVWTCIEADSMDEAFNDLQCAVNRVSSGGDKILAYGKQTLTTSIEIKSKYGSETAGFIKLFGCDSNGNEGKANFTLDGNNTATNCLLFDDIKYWYFANLEIIRASSKGIKCMDGYCYRCILNKISAYNNGSAGINLYRLNVGFLLNCTSHDNSDRGFEYVGSYSIVFACSCYNNGDTGFYMPYSSYTTLISCIEYNNNGYACYTATSQCLYNCVTHGVDKIRPYGDFLRLLCSRFTGGASGDYKLYNTKSTISAFSYYQNDGSNWGGASGVVELITLAGEDTNVTNGSDTDYGYNDPTNHDFSLNSEATLRGNTFIEITNGE